MLIRIITLLILCPQLFIACSGEEAPQCEGLQVQVQQLKNRLEWYDSELDLLTNTNRRLSTTVHEQAGLLTERDESHELFLVLAEIFAKGDDALIEELGDLITPYLYHNAPRDERWKPQDAVINEAVPTELLKIATSGGTDHGCFPSNVYYHVAGLKLYAMKLMYSTVLDQDVLVYRTAEFRSQAEADLFMVVYNATKRQMAASSTAEDTPSDPEGSTTTDDKH